MAPTAYNYSTSLKSDLSDEPVNVYLQRPLAGLLVRILYPTAVTPNQVTLAAIVFGIAGAIFIPFGGGMLSAAGALVYLKDIFDSADGQLARAKQLYSRRGRFLDSIGDFAVNLLLFAGIGILMFRRGYSAAGSLGLALCGFLGVTLRVSYHVFYQTAFLHTFSEYQTNRLSEEFREEDYGQDPTTRRLQRMFQLLYGWQDRLMAGIDRIGRRGIEDPSTLEMWYRDVFGLRLGGMLGLGTEYVMMTICLLLQSPEAYLIGSLGVLNLFWIAAVLYRSALLRGRLLR